MGAQTGGTAVQELELLDEELPRELELDERLDIDELERLELLLDGRIAELELLGGGGRLELELLLGGGGRFELELLLEGGAATLELELLEFETLDEDELDGITNSLSKYLNDDASYSYTPLNARKK